MAVEGEVSAEEEGKCQVVATTDEQEDVRSSVRTTDDGWVYFSEVVGSADSFDGEIENEVKACFSALTSASFPPFLRQARLLIPSPPALLAASSASLLSLTHLTVFLSPASSMSLFPRINAVYSSYFGTSPPTRACVAVAQSEANWRVKLEGCARKEGEGRERAEERKALHVQGLSYWAAANIGPYSQAVKVRLPFLVSLTFSALLYSIPAGVLTGLDSHRPPPASTSPDKSPSSPLPSSSLLLPPAPPHPSPTTPPSPSSISVESPTPLPLAGSPLRPPPLLRLPPLLPPAALSPQSSGSPPPPSLSSASASPPRVRSGKRVRRGTWRSRKTRAPWEGGGVKKGGRRRRFWRSRRGRCRRGRRSNGSVLGVRRGQRKRTKRTTRRKREAKERLRRPGRGQRQVRRALLLSLFFAVTVRTWLICKSFVAQSRTTPANPSPTSALKPSLPLLLVPKPSALPPFLAAASVRTSSPAPSPPRTDLFPLCS